ncbi:amino acid permease [Clostridium omnivorum]|uniref:Amino acid permease n=1 Tax=Clostridium omnivorum TaxID=1604902 RepID=A0ABQ5N4S0_9CLOT|nr:amino acid permease [Clostridium sp. E14]GLC30040.1 amino acid permease [Clostridium sp. E14]
MNSLFRKKDVDLILSNNKSASTPKTLGAFDVTLMSIGATIGTGVMVLTGVVAARDAGPAVVLSFICSAIICILVALCYAEFASTIPTSGSAYTYIYVSLGEFVAHLIGWSLVIGYTLSTATVAGGWSAYFTGLLNEIGIHLPKQLTAIPSQGGIINLPAVLVVLLITILLSRGTKESKKINNLMVVVKLSIIVLFVIVGVFYIKPQNWHPFMPFGYKGVFAGAASVFFAFSGFDAVSTSAEEVKNPQRNLPIGIVSSLIICTVIYIVVCLILTGITHYTQLNVADAMSYALSTVGQSWAASIISVGAVIGIMAVMLAYSYGASRILFSMSRDGLLPKKFSKVNKKTNVPVLSTWVVGILGAMLTGMVDLKQLADLANIILIGTFMLVAFSVIVLRKTHPKLKRNFIVPLVPTLPIVAVICCLFLMFNLSKITWVYFAGWLVLGTIVYFTYSRKHSTLEVKKQGKNELKMSA